MSEIATLILQYEKDTKKSALDDKDRSEQREANLDYNLKIIQGEEPKLANFDGELVRGYLDETSTTKVESEAEQIKGFNEFISKDSKKSTQEEK